MSLFVAVTLVPVLCSRLLVLPPPPDKRSGIGGRLYSFSERFLESMDEGYRRLLHLALSHRPIVVGLAVASVVVAAIILPTLPTELATQADEGQVQVSVELAQGTRIEVTDPVLQRVEAAIREIRAGSDRHHHQRRAAAASAPAVPAAASVNRGSSSCSSSPRTSAPVRANRSPWTCGASCPAFRASSSAPVAVGRQQPVEPLPVGRQQGRRPSLARNSRREPRRCAQGRAGARKTCWTRCRASPMPVWDATMGRPELAVRVDRAKAALLRRERAPPSPTRSAPTSPAHRRRSSVRTARNIRSSCGSRGRPAAERHRDVNDVLISTPQRPGAAGEEPDAGRGRRRPVADSAQEPAADRLRQRRARSDAQRCGEERAGSPAADSRPAAEGLLDRLRRRSRAAGARPSISCGWC